MNPLLSKCKKRKEFKTNSSNYKLNTSSKLCFVWLINVEQKLLFIRSFVRLSVCCSTFFNSSYCWRTARYFAKTRIISSSIQFLFDSNAEQGARSTQLFKQKFAIDWTTTMKNEKEKRSSKWKMENESERREKEMSIIAGGTFLWQSV